jgi:hypothetical protein
LDILAANVGNQDEIPKVGDENQPVFLEIRIHLRTCRNGFGILAG